MHPQGESREWWVLTFIPVFPYYAVKAYRLLTVKVYLPTSTNLSNPSQAIPETDIIKVCREAWLFKVLVCFFGDPVSL